MKVSADILYELDRLRKANFKWKFMLLAVGAVLIMFSITKGGDSYNAKHIARIKIENIITDNVEVISSIHKLAEDKNVAAVIVQINSPGGSPYMSEEIYRSLRKVSASKPVASVIGSLAASGGFMVAMAGDKIFAGETSITGSIGAIMQTVDASVLAEKIGVKFKNYSYPAMKGLPNPTEPTPPYAEKILKDVVKDVYDSFLNIVALRRNIPKQELQEFADGRIYTGRQAVKLKLIDQIGGEDDALEWFYSEKEVLKNIPVKDIELEEKNFSIHKLASQFPKVFFIELSHIVTDNLINHLKLN